MRKEIVLLIQLNKADRKEEQEELYNKIAKLFPNTDALVDFFEEYGEKTNQELFFEEEKRLHALNY